MAVWNDRQVLTMTLVVTLGVTVLLLLTTADWVLSLFMVPLVASAAFWSLRISRNVASRVQKRYEPPPPPPTTSAQPTSERPEHAQRRRQRRRQRGRREGGRRTGG